jgi:hypothetical protein
VNYFRTINIVYNKEVRKVIKVVFEVKNHKNLQSKLFKLSKRKKNQSLPERQFQ